MLKKINKFVFLALTGVMLIAPNFAFAQQASSNNYAADEIFMGPGGSNDTSSTNYTATGTIGDVAQGTSEGTSNDVCINGISCSPNPELEVTLAASSIDMGVFSPTTVSTGTATFSVRSYLSSGYVVYSIGTPPSASGGAQIDAMTTGGTSTPGTEQFGINLVANSSPNVGANPTQTPDSTFSFGYAANNYNTANNFRYNSGDAIARSDSSSGVTNYTISYIVNVHPVTTPAGKYIFRQSIVVTATF